MTRVVIKQGWKKGQVGTEKGRLLGKAVVYLGGPDSSVFVLVDPEWLKAIPEASYSRYLRTMKQLDRWSCSRLDPKEIQEI